MFQEIQVGLIAQDDNSNNKTDTTTKWIDVILQPKKDPKAVKDRFAICVKPMYEYKDVARLIEFIEIYRILGVAHFIFYPITTSSQVAQVLDYYSNKGLLTQMSWSYLFGNETKYDAYRDLVVYGQMATMNDCNLRTIHKFEYVIHVDTDELILPGNDTGLTNLQDLARHAESEAAEPNQEVGTISIRNVFHFTDWPDTTLPGMPDFSLAPDDPWLISVNKLRRSTFIHGIRVRTKYYVRPEAAIMLITHRPFQLISGKMNGLL